MHPPTTGLERIGEEEMEMECANVRFVVHDWFHFRIPFVDLYRPVVPGRNGKDACRHRPEAEG